MRHEVPLQLGICVLFITMGSAGVSRQAPQREITGRIIESSNGISVIGAKIQVVDQNRGVIRVTESDQEGRFTFGALPGIQYQVTLTQPNLVPTTVLINTQSSLRISELVLPMIRYGILTGRRVSGAVLATEVVPPGILPRIYRGTATPDGEFRILVPPGRYTVASIDRGVLFYPSNSRPHEFEIRNSEEHGGINFPQTPGSGADVSGTVATFDGSRTPSILTTLVSSDHPFLMVAATPVSANGTFRFRNIFPGTYDVLVSAMINSPQLFGRARIIVDQQSISGITVRMEPGRHAEFTLEGSCMQTGSATLAPVETWSPGRAITKTATLTAGNISKIEGLYPGLYQLSAKSSDAFCVPTTGFLDLRNGHLQGGVLLKKPGNISGNVVRSNQSVMRVVLRDLEPGRESQLRIFVANDGNAFEFENLLPGNYCLAAGTELRPSTCTSANVELSAGELKSVLLKYEE